MNSKTPAQRATFYTVAETATLLRVDAATIYRARSTMPAPCWLGSPRRARR